MKGMLAMADASSSPSNENGSVSTGDRLKRLPEWRSRAERHEQVEPQDRRRQHERHREQRFEEQLPAKLTGGQQAPQPQTERQQDHDRPDAEPQGNAKR